MRAALLAVCCLASLFATSCGGDGDTAPPAGAKTDAVGAPRTTATAVEPIELVRQQLSLDEQAGQLVITKIDGTELAEADAEAIREQHLGGVIMFGNNYESPEQMREFTAALQDAGRAGNDAEAELFISVDQEGGEARRFPALPPEQSASQLGREATAKQAREIARASGVALADLGVNMNLAPVADLLLPPRQVMAGRSFGADPRRVSQLVRATVEGFQQGGVIAVVKHFPGLGGSTANSDDAIAYIDRDSAAIDEQDLEPFRAAIAADVGSVMMSHGVYRGFDSETPASIGPDFIIPVLRDRLHYDGVVMTDSLNAKGLREVFGNTVPQACVESVKNGVDIALVTGSMETATLCRRRIRDAVESGEISRGRFDEAVLHVLRLKQQYGLLDVAAR